MAGYIGNKSSVTLVDGITKNGGTLEGDLSFGDNDKAIFGDADELQIYNDGTHSVISESGPGAFKITADAGLWIQSNNGEFRINTDANGAVALYYDNAVKLATTSTGIDVTGEVTTTGNVGIGTTPSTDWRTSFNTTATQVGLTGSLFNLDVSTGDRRCMVSSNAILNASGDFQHILEGHATIYSQQSGTHRWYTAPSASAGATAAASERMRIDSSGNVLVGTTNVDPSFGTTVGSSLQPSGQTHHSSAGTSLILNRTASYGTIAQFRKGGTTVGSISTFGGRIGIAHGNTRFVVDDDNNAVYFTNNSDGGLRDNTTDLGKSNARLDNIYATNGTIQTSDFNEKQDIASLTATEMLVGKRISTLFKTFRWKDSVAEKGENARTHTGVIAQDVQAAFTAEGLDAGDYALFISTTWWETQTEVPAVEAVAEVTDEDGNVTTEAVEAKDAYTRTDTYDTEAEAPEGATSKTRMGIRYPELLSFVAAYNEQRFASIEARLTALEA